MPNPLSLTQEKVSFPGGVDIFLWQIIDGHDNFYDFENRADLLFMQKSKDMVSTYQNVKENIGQSANILEIGTLHGASAAFLHQLFEPNCLVTIDLHGPKPVLEKYKSEHAPDIIRPYYGVDQSDSAQIRTIIESNFIGPIDLVIDDASHQYDLTKASFETVLPYMRGGGIYVIEDWLGPVTIEQKTTPDLVCEFVVAMTAEDGAVIDMRFGPMMVWIKRGWATLPRTGFHLPSYRR
jgi:cephalosporin hydroxylase